MEPLIDGLGRRHTYLRISVTDRCNLHCIYCMPAAGIAHRDREEILRFNEITHLAEIFARLGVRKIRLTGGEPLVRRNLEELVAGLAAIQGLETLAMTTNGVLLQEHARSLKAAGMRRLNISLDTLRPERFERIALRAFHGRVLAGIESALATGFAPLKLNMVVMGGINDDELFDFVEFVRDRPIQARFIEYMPFKANQWGEACFVPYAAMRRTIETRHPLIPLNEDEAAAGQVAKEFRIAGHRGTVGFITSMSAHFCQGCDRLRLTADGSLKSCLFSRPEASLRELLRAGSPDEALTARIREVLAGKQAAHPPLEELAALAEESMIEIGG